MYENQNLDELNAEFEQDIAMVMWTYIVEDTQDIEEDWDWLIKRMTRALDLVTQRVREQYDPRESR